MRKVLIIEDNNDIAEMMKMLLIKNRCDVRINVLGRNVVEEVIDYNPDLILMDVVIPEKSGFDICKELKELHQMPIILISFFNKNEKALAECNADGFIQKPFHLKDLFETINSHIPLSTKA